MLETIAAVSLNRIHFKSDEAELDVPDLLGGYLMEEEERGQKE